jgi:hypothetical protein
MENHPARPGEIFMHVALVMALWFTALAPVPREKETPAPSASPLASSADALFSRRAMRNARLLIQIRLLELREERLECVRAAILRRLPAELLPPGSNSDAAKHRNTAPGSYRGLASFGSEGCAWQLRAVNLRTSTG